MNVSHMLKPSLCSLFWCSDWLIRFAKCEQFTAIVICESVCVLLLNLD